MRATRTVLAGVAAVVLGACSDSGSPVIEAPTSTERPSSEATTSTSAPAADEAKRIEVKIVGGAPEGGVRTESVTLGDEVLLQVTSDVADEVHVHTYDVKVDVAPGAPAELRFVANIPGVFEVELEERGRQLLKLEVRPG